MSRVATIWDIRNPDGSPRFYPPMQHPASESARKALAELEVWELDHLETEVSKQYRAYLERQIAVVEVPEVRLRREAALRLAERADDE